MKQVDALDVLLTRLTWASVIVRERAVTEVARLLLSQEHGATLHGRLLTWMAEQRLETRAAIGLLVFTRARALGGYEPPDESELAATVNRPSILSLLLMRHLCPQSASGNESWPLDVVGGDHCRALHSGDAPLGYLPPPAFAQDGHLRFLASNHFARGRHLERKTGLPFMRQWAFEWERLAAEVGLNPSEAARHFWYGYHRDDSVTVDTLLSDVYRSAYLRTLAWCAGTGRMAAAAIVSLAAGTCPLDLALWDAATQSQPDWWPTASRSAGAIDTIPAQIWRQVEGLLGERRALGDDWVIAYAEGLVYDGGADDKGMAYRLDIGGLFQWCHGPASPDEDSLAHWYFGREVVLSPWGASPLRFEGVFGSGPPDTDEFERALGHFGDAHFLPAVDLAGPTAWPRWQHWRVPQGIAVPSRLLSVDEPIYCRGTRDGFEFVRDGEVVAVWQDWARAVRERGDPTVASACGNFLVVRRSLIQEVAESSGATYAWVCRVTGRPCKERLGQKGERIDTARLFGGTALLRP